jgi:hypothetical protein
MRSRPQDDPADDVGVDGARRLDLPSCCVLDLRDDRLGFVVGELARGGELDGEPTLLACHQPLELGGHLLDLPRAALLGHDEQEVLEERLLVARDVGQDLGLRGRVELRVAQDRAELG